MGFFRLLLGLFSRKPEIMPEPEIVESAPTPMSAEDFMPSDKTGVILIGMQTDAGATAGNVITSLLGAIPMLSVKKSGEDVNVAYGNSMVMQGAVDQARDILLTENADLAIIGASTGDGAAVGLWFISADEGSDGTPGRFDQDDILIAPSEFPSDVQNAIVGAVVAAACAASPASAQRLSPALKHYAEMLSPLVATDLAELTDVVKPGVYNAIGNVLATRARFVRDEGLYERAIQSYKFAAAGYDKTLAPLSWSCVQGHIATALQSISLLRNAEDEDKVAGQASMEEAAEIYRSMCETLSAEIAPRAWAQAQIDFAMLTYRVAVKAGTHKPFRDSLKALQSAQSVFARETMPSKWSEIMNNMGVILLTMGEDRGDDGILKHAIASFEQALQVRRRETMPRLWAATANNLGAASFALGKRTQDREAMSGAARNFEGAMEVYEELGQTKRAQVIEKNLSRVRRLIETVED